MGLETRGCWRMDDPTSLGNGCGGKFADPDCVFTPEDLSADMERPSRGVLRSVIVDKGRRSSAARASALMGLDSNVRGGSCKDMPLESGGLSEAC